MAASPALALLLPLVTASGRGLLVVGGYNAETSAEVWAPPPEEAHCNLPSLPSNMWDGLTADTVEGRVLACYNNSCLELTGSGWEARSRTLHNRTFHTSAVTSEGLLLLGGLDSPVTTELLPVDGGPSRESFPLQPGRQDHCSIQVSADTIVLTGGLNTESLVTELSGLGTGGEVTSKDLPALLHPRYIHVCGAYTVDKTTMLIVSGGWGGQQFQPSTEVMAHPEGSWREAGPLPSVRYGAVGASLAGVFHISGGWHLEHYLDEILGWDPVAETWSLVGHLATARRYHGATEVDLDSVAGLCTPTEEIS